jgi:hypothetical protein
MSHPIEPVRQSNDTTGADDYLLCWVTKIVDRSKIVIGPKTNLGPVEITNPIRFNGLSDAEGNATSWHCRC